MMSRVTNFICAVIDADLSWGAQTVAQFIVRSLQPIGTVVLAISRDNHGAWLDTAHLYKRLQPLSDNEIVISSVDEEGVYQPVNESPRRISKAEVKSLLQTAGIDDLLARLESPSRCMFFISRVAWPGNFGAVQSAVSESTWLGGRGLPVALRTARYLIRIGAGQFELRPKLGDTLCLLGATTNSHICFYRCDGSPGTSVPIRSFTGASKVQEGAVEVSDLLPLVGIPASETYGFEIKSSLRIDAYGAQAEGQVRKVVQEALNNADKPSTDVLQSVLAADVRESKRRKLISLQRRIDDLHNRERLSVKLSSGENLEIRKPSNENETVILAVRLEKIIANHGFPGFKILEYTSREGIDALVYCQFGEGSPSKVHTAEFEFDVRSFFAHGHPFQQVEMIICWSADSLLDGRCTIGELGANRSQTLQVVIESANWTRSITFSGHTIRVLALNRLLRSLGA